jgi:hypothetical protein
VGGTLDDEGEVVIDMEVTSLGNVGLHAESEANARKCYAVRDFDSPLGHILGDECLR